MGKTRYRKLKTKSNISSITTMDHGIKKFKYRSFKQKKQTRNGIQNGGFIEWIRLKWNLFWFKRLVGKFNRLEVDIKSQVDAYKARADYFEKFANDYAQTATNFIINTRQLTILEIFKKDKDELVASDPLTSKKVARNIDISKSREIGITEDINAQVKIMSKEIPQFNKLKSKFEDEAERFKSYVKEFSKMRSYQSELKSWQTKYNSLSGQDTAKLSSNDQDFLKTYGKRKDEYEQIIRLSDDVIQTHMENVNEIDNLLIKAQYFKSQFGMFVKEDSRLRTRKKGDIDKAKNVADKKLKEWKKKFTEFAKKMFTVSEICDKIIKNLEGLEQASKICLTNMYTIYKTEKNDRSDVKIQKHNVDAMTTFNQDISELIKDFNVAAAHIKELKREFYYQTPAVRMGYDYIPLTSAFNYLELRLDLYKKVLNNVKYKTQSGGGRTCKFVTVTNQRILEARVTQIADTLNELHNELKSNDADCYRDYVAFKKNFYNFFNYWLFCLYMVQDIITNPGDIPDVLKPSLRSLVDMAEVLENCGTGKTHNYDDVKNYFEVGFRDKITITPDIKKNRNLEKTDFRNNNLFHIFIRPGITAIKTSAEFKYLDTFLTNINANLNDNFDFLGNAPALKTYIETQIKVPGITGYPFTPGATSARASGSKSAPITIAELATIKDSIDSSPLLLSRTELGDMLGLILPIIQEQEDMEMSFKDTDKINKDLDEVLNEIKNKVASGSGITAQEDLKYRRIISLYINYWGEVKGIYEYLKTNGVTNDKTAKNKALEYWSYLDKYVYDSTIAKDKLIASVSGVTGATGLLGSPPALAAAIAAGGTPMAVTGSSGVPNSGPPSAPGLYPLGPKSQALDDKDVKLLENILIQIPTANELQYNNIKAEVDNMKAILNDVIQSRGGLIKDLADDLQRMTQLLFEVKYLEPDLQQIKVKKDESINLDLSWVLKPLDAELKESHKLATSNQLEEMIKKHPEMYKIHQQKSTTSGNVLENAYSKLAPYFGSVFELTKEITKLYTDSTYSNMFNDKGNVEAFLKIVEGKLDPKSNTPKACVILEGLQDVVKYINKPEITKLLDDKKKEWDSANNCKKKPQTPTGQTGQQDKPPKPGQGVPTTKPPPRYGVTQ